MTKFSHFLFNYLPKFDKFVPLIAPKKPSGELYSNTGTLSHKTNVIMQPSTSFCEIDTVNDPIPSTSFAEDNATEITGKSGLDIKYFYKQDLNIKAWISEIKPVEDPDIKIIQGMDPPNVCDQTPVNPVILLIDKGEVRRNARVAWD